MGGFLKFGCGMGKVIAHGLCDWERHQGMSDWSVAQEKAEARKKAEKRQREAYKRAFGVYPEDTWKIW